MNFCTVRKSFGIHGTSLYTFIIKYICMHLSITRKQQKAIKVKSRKLAL